MLWLANSSVTRAEEPAVPSAPILRPYEDKLLDLSDAETQASFAADGAEFDSAGWARGWRLEGFGSALEQNEVRQYERGVAFGAHIDTPNYGALSLDASARLNPGASVFSLWQREMPFDRNWTATNGLGMINSAGIDLAREQYRFAVPTFPIAGLATTWRQFDAVQLNASFG